MREFEVIKKTPLPAEYGIFLVEMKNVDRTKELRLDDGNIRLCQVSLSTAPYFENEGWYNLAKEKGIIRASYEDYQWENETIWRIFVKREHWDDNIPSRTIVKGAFEILKNGLAIINVYEDAPWSQYKPLTKQEGPILVEILDICEKSYMKFKERNTSFHTKILKIFHIKNKDIYNGKKKKYEKY